MTREILFRGKRDGDGKWVMGDRAGYSDYVMIWDLIDKGVGYLVDPATVGQFTGLCDKNGKKIFEGDVLSKEDSWTFYIGYENGSLKATPSITKLSSNWASYMDNFLRFGLYDHSDLWEIIGNIHDNPELLKEEAE